MTPTDRDRVLLLTIMPVSRQGLPRSQADADLAVR